MADVDPQDEEEGARDRARLILRMRQTGIRDPRVVRAMEAVPRRMFVPDHAQEHAYADRTLPIECGQTINQPFLVAYMTLHLEVAERHKVLEIGTGSGYQTAVLAHLTRRVFTIDRYRTLVAAAEQRFAALGIANVTAMAADGMTGWPNQAPFDRIIVTAAGHDVPPALLGQLAEGGILLAPVGPPEDQKLVRVEKSGHGMVRTDLIPVRFVPLVPGKAASL
ncbi:protein-L-isoaspartate(D-aspartate) O-methyltransferase [Terrihabitans sp. B22-R8]|uniref:protein-L-isoaspartate(D-aspartate) O-methyltransferase n=1 Tax=Terrihabitans sp. B22-R8 TaxID=3425128 RepID=UPI00403D3AD4